MYNVPKEVYIMLLVHNLSEHNMKSWIESVLFYFYFVLFSQSPIFCLNFPTSDA